MLKIIKYIVFFVFLVFSVPGCGSDSGAPGTASVRVGDTHVSASIGEPNVLLPVISADSASSAINNLVYNGLVKYDKAFNIVGDLAESWEVSDGGRTLTFHLRRDVTWHDGQPFTSADVEFTYRLYIDPNVPTAYAERYKQVAWVKTPDPYTFIAHYDKPLAPALISWGVEIHPKHLLEGQDVTKSPLGRAPVGTGPFKFQKWVPGERIELLGNPNYFEGPPGFHRVVVRIIPDQTTQFLELRFRGIDQMSLTPLQYARQTDQPAFRRFYEKYRYLASSYTYVGYNQKRELFKDKRVRQALTYAIDREEIIEGVLLGLGQPAHGSYKPGTWPYNPNVPQYPFDPQRARDLLKEAGWEDRDGDGILDKDGKPFQFALITNQGNAQRIQSGEIIQRRLQDIGIDVTLRVLEWATFLKNFIDIGNFDACILGWNIPPDPDSYNVWHSSKTGKGQLNFIGFSHPEVDALLEEGRRLLDQGERQKVYHRFQEILAEEQPYTFLYVSESLQAVSRRFQGIEPAPAGISHNFEKWYVSPEEQRYTR